MTEEKWTYRRSGVDIDLAREVLSTLGQKVKQVQGKEVISGIGGFAGIFELPSFYYHPCLVASSDGIGTKLKIALALNQHDTVGIDLVAMSVNDILCSGARPLFFLDYFACGKLNPGQFEAVLSGIIRGCQQAHCSLLGGETAEMPDMYPEEEYDLAGFALGVVEKKSILPREDIRAGDAIVGLASSGLHSNGFSLVRKILAQQNLPFDTQIEGHDLAAELLRPTRIYSKPVLAILKEKPEVVKGIAHITGGGLVENVPRIIPPSLAVEFWRNSWEIPWIFSFLKERGNLSQTEMDRVFNLGLGLILVVDSNKKNEVVEFFSHQGEKAWVVGEVVKPREEAKFFWIQKKG